MGNNMVGKAKVVCFPNPFSLLPLLQTTKIVKFNTLTLSISLFLVCSNSVRYEMCVGFCLFSSQSCSVYSASM